MQYRFTLLSVFIAFCLQPAAAQVDVDSAAIVAAFEDYKAAVGDADGKKVLPLLAQRSLQYYDHLAGLVIFADSLELTQSAILDATMVINLRTTVPKEELLKMDGAAMAVHIFNIGKQGRGGLGAQTIGNIEYGGGAAVADILLDGNTSEFKYTFFLEDGQWKIDPTAVFALSEKTMQDLLEANNLSITRFLEIVSRNQYQRELDPDVWKPLRKM
jgi:hypothetical protein